MQIRNRILMREEELTGGDQLMIVRNNYFWLQSEEEGSTGIHRQRRYCKTAQGTPDGGDVWFPLCGCAAGIYRLRRGPGVGL
jgi:hypothetical protein